MALQKTVTTTQGFTVVDAYHRVQNVVIPNKQQITFALCSYVSTDKPLFEQKTFLCAYDLEKSNPIKQAYEFLKTLPEFKDAFNC